MLGLINKLTDLYWKRIASPIQYAKHIGVKVGDNTLIATRNWPTEPYLITIGDNVQVTTGVSMYTHGGVQSIREKYPDFDIFGKITIEDWVYIGACSQILPGVTIGRGSLVAAGSVVTKSVASNTVVGGNPAKFICTIEEYYERNKSYNIGTKSLSYGEKKRVLLSMPDNMFIKK